MFAQLNPATARRQSLARVGSLALHAGLLAWLLHAPEPIRLNPTSVVLGRNGNSVTRLYWRSNSAPDDSTHSSSDDATEHYRHQRLGHEKLTWKAPALLAKLAPGSPHPPRRRGYVQNADPFGSGSWHTGRLALWDFESGTTLRRRTTPCLARGYLRSGGLSLGIARPGGQCGGRNYHRRARRDCQQDSSSKPRSQTRRASSART